MINNNEEINEGEAMKYVSLTEQATGNRQWYATYQPGREVKAVFGRDGELWRREWSESETEEGDIWVYRHPDPENDENDTRSWASLLIDRAPLTDATAES